MPHVTWILPDGKKISADVSAGANLMTAAVANNVSGVVGECGGCLSCATCHVYVDDAWLDKVGPPDSIEDAMLEVTDTQRTSSSRLSCQIEASQELDGLILHVPQ